MVGSAHEGGGLVGTTGDVDRRDELQRGSMNEKELNKWRDVLGVDFATGPDTTVVSIPTDTRVYIVAEEHGHAEWFAKKIRIQKKQYRYVREAHDLYGAEGVIIFYETAWRMNYFNEIRELADIMIGNGRLLEIKQEFILHE
jgi:hypothetical protein